MHEHGIWMRSVLFGAHFVTQVLSPLFSVLCLDKPLHGLTDVDWLIGQLSNCRRYGDCLGASGWESVLEMVVVLYRCGALPDAFCAALAGDGEGGLVSGGGLGQ